MARDLNVEVRGLYFRVFYDALTDVQNLIDNKKSEAQATAKQLEKEMQDVQQFQGKERDIQEMKSRMTYATFFATIRGKRCGIPVWRSWALST